jgi:hypothetical protein
MNNVLERWGYLHQVLVEAGGGPLAELGAAAAAHAVADGDDGLEVVVLNLAKNLAISFTSNHPEFPDSCLAAELALVEDVHEVLVDRADVLLEQVGDQRLREPDGVVLEAALDARAASSVW